MTNMKIASEVQCTVVVVGDSRTGKTSLIQRFVNNSFASVHFTVSMYYVDEKLFSVFLFLDID